MSRSAADIRGRYATAFGADPSPEQLIQTFVNRPVTERDAVGYRRWHVLDGQVTDLTRWNQFLLTGTPAVVNRKPLPSF
jgi:hypothetical protein